MGDPARQPPGGRPASRSWRQCSHRSIGSWSYPVVPESGGPSRPVSASCVITWCDKLSEQQQLWVLQWSQRS
jgi:hypothetical protein